MEDEQGQRLLKPTPHITFGPGLEAVRRAMLAAGAPCEALTAAAARARRAASALITQEPGSSRAGPPIETSGNRAAVSAAGRNS